MMTCVNVITIKPGQQQVAFDRIHQVYPEIVREQLGLINAQLLTIIGANNVEGNLQILLPIYALMLC